MLMAAALLVIFIGLVHSVLGEKYILIRLFRKPLPKLFGNDEFTKKTLRFAWHVTTIAWFGFAAILVQLSWNNASETNVLLAIAATFGITGLIALIASKGKHLSWLVFGTIAILTYVAAGSA